MKLDDTRARRIHGILKAERMQMANRIQPIMDVVDPGNRMTVETGTIIPGGVPPDALITTVLPSALDVNANGQFQLNFPIGTQWLQLKNRPGKKAKYTPEKLAEISEVLLAEILSSQFAAEVRSFLLDRSAYGTAAMWVSEAEGGGVGLRKLPLSGIGFKLDTKGRIIQFSHETWMHPAEMVETYGEANFPSDFVQNAESPQSSGTRRRVVGVLERAGDKYEYVEFCEGMEGALDSRTFSVCPAIIAKYYNRDNNAWGKGIGELALPSHNQHEGATKLMDVAAEMEVFPPMLVSSRHKGQLGFGPGEVTYFDPSNPNARPQPLHTQRIGGGVLMAREKQLRDDIRELCDFQLFAPLMGADRLQDMKATVAQIIEGYGAKLASHAYARLVNEFVQPLVHNALAILAKNGVVDIDAISIELCSPMQAALSANKLEVFERTALAVAPLLQADPTLAQRSYRPRQILSDILRSAGAPSNWLVTEEEERAAQNEQKAAQFAQMANETSLAAAQASAAINKV